MDSPARRTRSKTGSLPSQKKAAAEAPKSKEFKPPTKEALIAHFSRTDPWLLYPSGSIGGFFDFVPEGLRRGPWFSLAAPFLALFSVAVVCYKPTPLEFPDVDYPEVGSANNIFEGLAFLNGVGVLAFIIGRVGPPPLVTYTIWSWCILTFRLGSSFLISLLGPLSPPFLIWCCEFSRFPSLVAATVTFVLWNFLLMPVIYLFMKTPERRSDFVAFNMRFHMFEIHVFNYPIAVAATVATTARRSLVGADLWAAFFVAFLYSLLYLLVLDRLGVHLYPVFSPRFKGCIPAWCTVFVIYYGIFNFWNAFIDGMGVAEMSARDVFWLTLKACGVMVDAIIGLVTKAEFKGW